MFSVDNFLPEFIKTQETVIVSDTRSPDAVYTAQAYDGDHGTTCPSDAMLCDCAEITYSITEGNADRIFHVNNLTGDIYIKEASQVVSGGTYNLTITAASNAGRVSTSPNARMQVYIIL